MTTKYNLTESWTTITEAGSDVNDNFIIENIGIDDAQIKFGNGDAWHTLAKRGGSIVRAGVDGVVRARCAIGKTTSIVVSGV